MKNLNEDMALSIRIENEHFCLQLNENCVVDSLRHKPTGQECLDTEEKAALFAITEERPYNNEIKLAYPNKRTTFHANRVRREGDRLIVGFELIRIEAIVEVKTTPAYIAFTLVDFILPPEEAKHRSMMPPPVAEFRLLQLPVRHRERFGEWLGVMWDDGVAINILATSPCERIDSEKRKAHRMMYADAVKDIRMQGSTALLIVTSPEKLLGAIDQAEQDYGLPRGVRSRLSEDINASYLWLEDMNPLNADEYIAYAQQAGFRMMLISYRSIFYGEDCYKFCGNYDYLPTYPNGVEDLKEMLDKIKAAGIVPGLHFLHSHIGIYSRYVSPVADFRLNLKKHFTLSKAVSADDTVIYVEQNPAGGFTDAERKVLKFDGELISYESYTTERPYMFTGCKRGHLNTIPTPHTQGLIGGLLDISEFGAWSIHIDQDTSLQDEIADKLAAAYNAGFEFVYFDGSEGTQAPYEFHVSNAQYRVYKKLKPSPLFCEGAAKSHFSWHMLSGGNAFDVFPASVFKEKIREFPMDEAPKMAADFTRLNFGWWRLFEDTQPDMYEFGTSRAAAWNCPITLAADLSTLKTHPRRDDLLEVLARWEDVRRKKWLTPSQKKALQSPDQEHILLINESGAYEIVPYDCIKNAAGGNPLISAFVFERKGNSYVVCWHNTGEGKLKLDVRAEDVVYETGLGGAKIESESCENGIIIPVRGRRYLRTSLSKEELIRVFEKAVLL